jgi:hypothetical protein
MGYCRLVVPPKEDDESNTPTPASPRTHLMPGQKYVPYRDEPIPSPSLGGPTPTPSELERGLGGYSDGEVFQLQQQMMDGT